MKDDLLRDVQVGLQKSKGEWRDIAEAVPGVSYSWISKVARCKYNSAPSYERLKAVAEYLKSRSKGRPLVDHSHKAAA